MCWPHRYPSLDLNEDAPYQLAGSDSSGGFGYPLEAVVESVLVNAATWA
jgi:hypothetical protein